MVRTPGEQFGDYRLVRLLGEGGFAEVYEAEHVHLPGVKAAIKLLKGNFTSQQLEDLRREALMVSKLDHPHIVQLRTFSIEHNIPYLVMAYAQGGALNRRYPRGTRIALPEILSYVRPVAAALQYAHEQKIVHRDLKPANLLLTHDGRVQVADFGIAVVSHSSQSRTIQQIIGTWVYMAPEQFHGQAESRSDQYSMALMVYQWLCGNVPFDGNGNKYQIPRQQEEEAPPSLCAKLPDLLPAVEAVVMKALAKNPKERFADMQEFAEALEEASKPPFVPAPGQRLGDYQLVRKLGEGGFAEVYEAEHLHLGIRAAIKLLKGTFTAAQVEGLRQEALAIIKLDHPHIIRAYNFSLEGKIPYLVMAYASGSSLATRHERGAPLPLETICSYVRQIASALQYAHNQGIIHRDIKPGNILLAQDGRLQVADFGIAILAQTTQADEEVVGSWTYMAPEQFEERAAPASDQYALGIMAYEWLCGVPPFTGNGSVYALPYQQMNELPPSLCQRLPTLSPRIEQVVMQALAKQPAERFASVTAFAQALEEACTKPPIGTTLLTYEHLGERAESVAWSPDGTRIASGGRDATVRIWDAAKGQILHTLRGHASLVNVVAWSPDGRLLASASNDKTVQMWEAATGKRLLRYEGHTGSVQAVAWSPDGQKLASTGGSDDMVQVWEAATGKLLLRYRSWVQAVAWSPDGQLLAFALNDSAAQIWEAATGKLLLQYEGHLQVVQAIAWSPDGQLLASASADGTVQVWEAATGKLLQRYEGHTHGVNEVAWSPAGLLVASASNDNTVQVWEARTGRLLQRHKGQTVGWSPDGKKLVLTLIDQGVQVQEVSMGRLLQRYEGHAYKISALAWSPDGYLLASAASDKIVQVWEARTGKLLLQYKGHMDGRGSLYPWFGSSAVAWSPDGHLLASALENDKTVQVWEARTGKLLYKYEGHSSKVQAVAWSPDGRQLASVSADETAQVWEARTGKLLHKYEGHVRKKVGIYFQIGSYAVTWSPDGYLLASAATDGTVQVWEAAAGKLLQRYKGHVLDVAWSPDGQKLAFALKGNTVQVWEAKIGKRLQLYEGHTDQVHAVAWSPDGRLLASAAADRTVQVWVALTGKLLFTYHDHFTSVEDVVWSPDGEQIASAGDEVQVWVAPKQSSSV